jgi:hypothetical protein
LIYQLGSAGTYVRDKIRAHGDTAGERVAGVAAQALDELQDYFVEASHDPWPESRTPLRPFAQVRGQTLHLWYCGPDITSPAVLAYESILLVQIQRPH